MTIQREFIKSGIDSTNGKLFSVEFIKANGKRRKMVCRTGVKRYLKGGKSTTSHCPHLVTVYDVQAKGYRSVNLDTVLNVKMFGQSFDIRMSVYR